MLSSADLTLARRLEAGHAHSGRLFAAESETIAGGYANFGGIDAPVTQALAIGMRGPIAPTDLDRLEAFFHTRGSPAIIDLCTLADPSALALISERSYAVRELSNVLARRLDDPLDPPPSHQIEETTASEPWGRLMLEGFMDGAPVSDEQLALVSSGPVHKHFTLLDGIRSGTGGMSTDSGLATFFGDATLSTARGRGLQLASIRHRLHHAAQLNCDLASVSVFPGGISHRNYERAGFRMLYARVQISLALPQTR